MDDHIILVTKKDLLRISHVLSFQGSDEFESLELELDRAKVLQNDCVPADLVTMNSKFQFLNLQDDKEMTISLVYPSDSNFAEGKISVLAPLGSALLGLRVGQSINWMFPDGQTKTLKITRMLYQPEESEDWHL